MRFIAYFDCKTLTIFTLKCTSHGGNYGRHEFEKLAKRRNSECCNADFWPVRRLGSS